MMDRVWAPLVAKQQLVQGEIQGRNPWDDGATISSLTITTRSRTILVFLVFTLAGVSAGILLLSVCGRLRLVSDLQKDRKSRSHSITSTSTSTSTRARARDIPNRRRTMGEKRPQEVGDEVDHDIDVNGMEIEMEELGEEEEESVRTDPTPASTTTTSTSRPPRSLLRSYSHSHGFGQARGRGKSARDDQRSRTVVGAVVDMNMGIGIDISALWRSEKNRREKTTAVMGKKRPKVGSRRHTEQDLRGQSSSLSTSSASFSAYSSLFSTRSGSRETSEKVPVSMTYQRDDRGRDQGSAEDKCLLDLELLESDGTQTSNRESIYFDLLPDTHEHNLAFSSPPSPSTLSSQRSRNSSSPFSTSSISETDSDLSPWRPRSEVQTSTRKSNSNMKNTTVSYDCDREDLALIVEPAITRKLIGKNRMVSLKATDADSDSEPDSFFNRSRSSSTSSHPVSSSVMPLDTVQAQNRTTRITGQEITELNHRHLVQDGRSFAQPYEPAFNRPKPVRSGKCWIPHSTHLGTSGNQGIVQNHEKKQTPGNHQGSHEIYYEVHGNGKKKAMLVMGFGNSSLSYTAQIQHFIKSFNGDDDESDDDRDDDEQGYSICVFDNRGVGNSDCPRGPWRTSELADDAISLLDYLGWKEEKNIDLVGVSLGGMIALELASKVMERISSLTLCVTTPGSRGIWGNLPPRLGLKTNLYLPFERKKENRLRAIIE